MKYTIEEIKTMLEEADNDGMPLTYPHAIIRNLLAEVERYKRKHSKICGEGGCPPGGDCGGDDWTCKNCWAKYWEED